MSRVNNSSWMSKKVTGKTGGFSYALSIAADLGFSVSPSKEEAQNLCSDAEKGDDLVRVLTELTIVQRKIVDLQVELQGRQEDKNVAHLTHVSEMEKKIESLRRITTILKGVIQNKGRIIARLQQPYALDYISVEAEFQKQFYELLKKAASDYVSLTASIADFQWIQNFKEPPSAWGEMLHPIPVALASCTRYFEAISSMRESFAFLQKLRVGHSAASLHTSPTTSSQREQGDSDFVPFPWKNESIFEDLSPGKLQRHDIEHFEADDNSDSSSSYQLDISRLSWASSVKSNDW
ncbi:AUGMIN subunit 2-like [Apium graveolens]|uniref:AUGMIN subunit 2-like n=1 Tax=Apium graveolens TaxID=4045 RepID=UPI003D7B23B0